MAKGTTKNRRKAASKGGKSTAKSSAKKNGGQKREAAGKQTEALIRKVVALRKKDKSWAEVAEEISTTPGKAQYLMMLHRVEQGEVPRITGKTDAQLTAAIKKARQAADDYSSWGWISARAGIAEGRIKTLAKEGGFYSKGKENIAQKRAGTEDSGSKGKKGKKGKGKRGR